MNLRAILNAFILVTALTLVGTGGGSAASAAQPKLPEYVQRLQDAYGPPGEQGFGSAVFHTTLRHEASLAAAALEFYRRFVGSKWQQFGEQAWMQPWHEVYERKTGASRDIVTELRAIEDGEVRNSVPMILEVVEDSVAARAALSAAFDAPQVTELRVFNLGDGGALSGLLVAGRREPAGEVVILVFLMD
jgi:hypothetical protein